MCDSFEGLEICTAEIDTHRKAKKGDVVFYCLVPFTTQHAGTAQKFVILCPLT
jgi:hypothetical protein